MARRKNTSEAAVSAAEALLRSIVPAGAEPRIESGVPVPPRGARIPPSFPPAEFPTPNADWFVEIGSRVFEVYYWCSEVGDALRHDWLGRVLLAVLIGSMILAMTTLIMIGVGLIIIGIFVMRG